MPATYKIIRIKKLKHIALTYACPSSLEIPNLSVFISSVLKPGMKRIGNNLKVNLVCKYIGPRNIGVSPIYYFNSYLSLVIFLVTYLFHIINRVLIISG